MGLDQSSGAIGLNLGVTVAKSPDKRLERHQQRIEYVRGCIDGGA